MREILFRGKRTDNGEWVAGDLFHNLIDGRENERRIGNIYFDTSEEIHGTEVYDVIPETVGQYTGLIDKNGKKIFEGDIINIEYPMTTVKCAVVEYVGSAFVGSTDCDAWDLDNYYALEVIGNIHDNRLEDFKDEK